MKKIIRIIVKTALVILSVILVLVGGGLALWAYKKKVNHFWGGPLMSMEKVCATWGSAPLNTAKFKEVGDRVRLFYSQEHLFTPEEQKLRVPPPDPAPVRAKMACSLLKNQKKFHGKDTMEIRKTFGDYTGHYFSGMIPTYVIGKIKAKDEDSWQLVFFINHKRKIVEIVVHQNCCSIYRDGPTL